MGNNPTNGVDPNGGIFEKQRAQFSAWIHGGTWGTDENNGYYSQWTDKQVAGHYFGQQQGASDVYNSGFVRKFIMPDKVSLSIGYSWVKFYGFGGNGCIVMFMRGPEALHPFLTVTGSHRAGWEQGVSVTAGRGNYLDGKGNLGNVDDITMGTVEGMGIDASLSVGEASGNVALGLNSNGTAAWVDFAAGPAVEAGASFGASYTKA